MGTELVKFKMLKKKKKWRRRRRRRYINLRLLEINNQHKVVEERIKTKGLTQKLINISTKKEKMITFSNQG